MPRVIQLCTVPGLQRGVIVGPHPYGLGINETILSQYLKQHGDYSTHLVGKVSELFVLCEVMSHSFQMTGQSILLINESIAVMLYILILVY